MNNITIQFPKNKPNGIKYYDVHYTYLLNVLRTANLNVALTDLPSFDSVGFKIYALDREVVIDFSDHLSILPGYDVESDIPYFKYHYSTEEHGDYKRVYPLTPVSFHDWTEYYNMRSSTVQYSAKCSMILNNQRPGGRAFERRKKVQKMLLSHYGQLVNMDYHPKDQIWFWNLINECLVSICVPGARNDMLDRGHIQYMAFGCCTLSPRLKCVLSWNKRPEPDVHYVECSSDYSNLIEKVEWCMSNRSKCDEIGKNASSLFVNTSTPPRMWEWMLKCITEEKK